MEPVQHGRQRGWPAGRLLLVPERLQTPPCYAVEALVLPPVPVGRSVQGRELLRPLQPPPLHPLLLLAAEHRRTSDGESERPVEVIPCGIEVQKREHAPELRTWS